MRRKAAAILALALWGVVPASSLSITEVNANFSLLYIATAPSPADSGGLSALAQLVGLSLPLSIAGPFSLEPTVELFGTTYQWMGTRPVPIDFEAGPAFFVLGSIVSLQSVLSLPVSSSLSVGGALGLDLVLRFPFDFRTDIPDRTAGEAPTLAYFFQDGRFFYPETRLFVRWQAGPRIGLYGNIRVLYPIFHLWDNEGLSFLDQTMASAGLGFSIRLGPTPAPAQTAAPTSVK